MEWVGRMVFTDRIGGCGADPVLVFYRGRDKGVGKVIDGEMAKEEG
jgi:hypothetical protein